MNLFDAVLLISSTTKFKCRKTFAKSEPSFNRLLPFSCIKCSKKLSINKRFKMLNLMQEFSNNAFKGVFVLVADKKTLIFHSC